MRFAQCPATLSPGTSDIITFSGAPIRYGRARVLFAPANQLISVIAMRRKYGLATGQLALVSTAIKNMRGRGL